MSPRNPNAINLQLGRLPKIIHIDTSFFISAIINDNSDKHKAAENFFRRLLKEKTAIALSTIVFNEFWNAALKIRIKDALRLKTTSEINLPAMIIDEKSFEEVQKHNKTVRADISLLFDLLDKFSGRCLIIHPNRDIMNDALTMHHTYAMGLMDAIHIATMRIAKEESIAAFDRYMENVLGINVWCMYC